MFVQFSDEAQARIQAVFAEPQWPDVYPNQGEVDQDDPRYVAFIQGLPVGFNGGYFVPPVEVSDKVEGRLWRDAEITRVAWLRDRHRDEVELGGATTITAEQYTELLGYIQQLRDWPLSDGFPDASSRPDVPGWIANQIQ